MDAHESYGMPTATYSPEDDKLRIYSGRVDQATYDRIHAAGFGRAHKQGCFFATWTPEREDIALELGSEIGDSAPSTPY
jgi:hypothetical protein